MPKSKRKSKKQQNREKRDFAETAFAVFQQAMGNKQPRARHPAQASFSLRSESITSYW